MLKYLYLIFFLFFTQILFGQNTKTFKETYLVDEFSFLDIANLNPKAGHKKWIELMAKAPKDKIIYYQSLGILDAAINYNLKDGLKFIKAFKTEIEESNDSLLKHLYYSNVANFYGAFGNYQLSNNNLLNALKYAQYENEKTNCKSTLCFNYLRQNLPQNVIDIYEPILAKALNEKDSLNYLNCYEILAQAYVQNNNFDKAADYLKKADYLIKTQNTLDAQSYIGFFQLNSANLLIESDQKLMAEKANAHLIKAALVDDFSDQEFLVEYLKIKQKYFDWTSQKDSSVFYKTKLANFLKIEDERRLQLMTELETEEKLEQQQKNIFLGAGVFGLLMLLGGIAYWFIYSQRQKYLQATEISGEVLSRYSTILKDKYKVISQTEDKLHELHKELKDDSLVKKIRDLKSTIKISDEESVFLANLNQYEISAYEKLRRTLPQFTEIEVRIAYLITEGKTINIISEMLNISVKATENHRYRIRKKMNLEKGESLEIALKSIVSSNN